MPGIGVTELSRDGALLESPGMNPMDFRRLSLVRDASGSGSGGVKAVGGGAVTGVKMVRGGAVRGCWLSTATESQRRGPNGVVSL